MEKTQQIGIQAKVFDFALMELVRTHRESFLPKWSIDSWAKFLIWLSLCSGLSGERESLELFANSLGPLITRRMRKAFFERTLEHESIYMIADPAESSVLLMPVSGKAQIKSADVLRVLEVLELSNSVFLDQSTWKFNEGIISIDWKASEIKS